MAGKEKWEARGILTVLNTPFDAAGRVDAAALRRNVRRALAAGVSGFLAPAMAAEVGRLAPEERALIVRSVLEEAAGAVPVIGGASAGTRAQRLSNVRRMTELGCPAVLVAVPYESDGQYEAEVREIDGLNPPLLMLQDWSASGYGVPVPLLVRLFETVPSFRALKVEVVPAGIKYSEVIAATGGRLHVSGGWAVAQMIEALDRGVDAFMPTGLHEVYCRIYGLHRDGRRGEARALFEEALPILAFSNQHLDLSIRFFKRLLWAEGIYPTPDVREPLLPFDAVHRMVADELIGRAIALTRRLSV